MSLAVNLIGQRSRDVIGRLSVSHDVIGFTASQLFIINNGLIRHKQAKTSDKNRRFDVIKVTCGQSVNCGKYLSSFCAKINIRDMRQTLEKV